jgi:hypothetical protein
VDADAIAALARQTCESADRAAKVAGEAAVKAAEIARLSRDSHILELEQAAAGKSAEGEAERLYREAAAHRPEGGSTS